MLKSGVDLHTMLVEVDFETIFNTYMARHVVRDESFTNTSPPSYNNRFMQANKFTKTIT